jgi:Family of unknown function (DUF6101)
LPGILEPTKVDGNDRTSRVIYQYRAGKMTIRAKSASLQRKKLLADVVAPQEVTAACVRAEDGLQRVAISSEWICIRRKIAGLETWVNVPTPSYRGVNLRAVVEGNAIEIVLLHMDPSLEIVLARTSDDTDVIALWRSYARMLSLPLLVEDTEGRLQTVEDSTTQRSFERRFGSALKYRRPRFLSRRIVGISGERMVHHGEREMGARA